MRSIIRSAAAVGIIAMILALFMHMSHIGRTAVVLILLLAVLGIAMRWGLIEAMVAAVSAGLLVEAFVLPPYGVELRSPQHWIAFSAFLVTAVATSQLSMRVRKKELEAEDRRRELERLDAFSRAFLQNGTFESTLGGVVEYIVKILGVAEAALYYGHAPAARLWRAGQGGSPIPEDELRKVAEMGCPRLDTPQQLSILPIHLDGHSIGSLGLSGVSYSRTAIRAIANRVGSALERAAALDESARSEAARKSQELKSVVLDALAHDLKTPLASIKAAVTCLLTDNDQSSPVNFDLLCVINEETDRLNRIMQEAVELTRVESGALSLERREYSIRETVCAALEDLNSTAEGRTVRIDIPETLPAVDLDFCLVKQVFKQLLDNALKYSPDGSPVVVSSEWSGDRITVDVVDSGPGIPDEDRNRIFEKFYRGRNAAQDAHGTGMGLAIAKVIVEKHGGSIWVTGRPDGSGAAFHVSLPIHEAAIN